MSKQPEPIVPQVSDQAPAPALLPYEPPAVQSVKLSDEAAESLT